MTSSGPTITAARPKASRSCPFVVRPPRLLLRLVDEALLDRGLDRPGPGLGDRIERIDRPGRRAPGDGDLEALGDVVGVPLVVGQRDDIPPGGRDAEEGRELLSVSRDRRDRLVPGGIQDPPRDVMGARERTQRRNRPIVRAQIVRSDGCADVSGCRRDRDFVIQHDHGDPPTTQAAGDPEALVVASDHQRLPRPLAGTVTGRTAGPQPAPTRCTVLVRAARPRSLRASVRPAYQLPETKRIVGPKLHAAGAPRMCRPGTEDSNPEPRRG